MKKFLWCLQRLVFPMLFGPSDDPPDGGGGIAKGGGDYKGGVLVLVLVCPERVRTSREYALCASLLTRPFHRQ